MEHLTFRVMDDEFGLDLQRVREVLGHAPLTRMPGAPAALRGVLNLRGKVVPVVDLAVRLGRGISTVGPRTGLVLVNAQIQGKPLLVGLMVDAVSGIVDLSPDAITPRSMLGSLAEIEVLSGIARVERALLPLLDVDVLVALDTMRAHAAPLPAVHRLTASLAEAKPGPGITAGGEAVVAAPDLRAPLRAALPQVAPLLAARTQRPPPQSAPGTGAVAQNAQAPKLQSSATTANRTRIADRALRAPLSPSRSQTAPSLGAASAPRPRIAPTLLPAPREVRGAEPPSPARPRLRRPFSARALFAGGMLVALLVLSALLAMPGDRTASGPRSHPQPRTAEPPAVPALPSGSSAASVSLEAGEMPSRGPLEKPPSQGWTAAPAAASAGTSPKPERPVKGTGPAAGKSAHAAARVTIRVPSREPLADLAVHLVLPGETLWALSGRYYGDPLLWREIYAHNRDHIRNPNSLSPGDRLRIPRRR
jgi:purine-binding chemotaxis protein CheW